MFPVFQSWQKAKPGSHLIPRKAACNTQQKARELVLRGAAESDHFTAISSRIHAWGLLGHPFPVTALPSEAATAS